MTGKSPEKTGQNDAGLVPWSVLDEAFFAQRTVLFTGEVEEKLCSLTAHRLMSLQYASMEPITLIIDSRGGEMDEALKLCDIMATLIKAPIRGIAVGKCGSAATFVMLYCDERLGTPNARFVIHSARRVRVTVPANATASEHLEQLLKETAATERQIERLYVERLTPARKGKMTPAQKLAFVRKLIARGDQAFDASMTAEEAIAAGLIQGVFNGKLDFMPQA